MLVLGWLGLAFAGDVERVEQGALVMEDVPTIPDDVRNRIRSYRSARSAGLVDFAGDGLLIRTRFAETTQLHRVAMPGGSRQQLTFYDEPVRTVVPHPTDPDRVLMLRDTGGDEQYQVVLLDLSTGEEIRISDGTGRCGSPTWSHDGKRVAWVQTEPSGSGRKVFVADPAAPEGRSVHFEADGAWGVVDWFPDGERLMLGLYVSARESEIHVLDLAKRKAFEVNPSKDRIAYQDLALSPDGETLYVVSDLGGDKARLWRMEPKKKARPALLSEEIDAEIDDVEVSPDGRRVLFTTNDDGRSDLFLRDVDGWSDVVTPDLPPGVLYGLSFDADSARVGLTLNRADAPGDVYTFPVGETELTRWTFSETGGLSGFVQPEMFRYPAADGLEIPAFVYRPETEGPHPVVVVIHGGPEGQSRPYFSTTAQFLVRELDVAVVYPNVRGSRGFGRAYLQMDNGLNRKKSVEDIGALLDWIGAQDDLDADRVAVMGGSYGGYMVLASLIDYADRLVGGIDIVGISDFKTFLKNTKDYRRDLRRAEYGDERDPEIAAFFDEISPLKNASRIQDPLFVVQGANDPRVPASEAEQIVAAVRESGNEAWYLLAMDEGHGFRKQRNRDVLLAAEALFFRKIFDLE